MISVAILCAVIVAMLIPILIGSISYMNSSFQNDASGGVKKKKKHGQKSGKTHFKLMEVDPHAASTWFASNVDLNLEYMDVEYHAFFHLRGGLGDILRHLFASGVGRYLMDMDPDERALVFLHSHTSADSLEEIAAIFPSRHSFFAIPWATNLYETHPKLQNLQAFDTVFTNRMEYIFKTVFTKNFEERHNLFSYESYQNDPREQPYVILQRCAGTRGRDIPMNLAQCITRYLNSRGVQVRHVGRHYKRGFVPNWSPAMFSQEKDELWDSSIFPDGNANGGPNDYEYLVDKVDIRSLRKQIAGSCGVITPFSSISLAAMEFNKPLLCAVIMKEDGSTKNYASHLTSDPKYHFWGSLEYTKAPAQNRYTFLDPENTPKDFVSLPSQIRTPPSTSSQKLHAWCEEACAHFSI